MISKIDVYLLVSYQKERKEANKYMIEKKDRRVGERTDILLWRWFDSRLSVNIARLSLGQYRALTVDHLNGHGSDLSLLDLLS